MLILNLICLINIACVRGDIYWIASLPATIARFLLILIRILILLSLVIIIFPKEDESRGKFSN
jgi:hypothetical protein